MTFTVMSSDLVAFELKSASSSRLRYAIPAGGGVSLPFLFAPGDHDVEVVDNTVAQTGGQSYSITPAITSANLAACNPVGLFEPGVMASLMLAASDCAGISAGTSSDRFFTYALTGQTLTVTMASAAFDPLLRVLNGQ
ncbi:MAG TPA: hypothetical protein VGP61_00565, partial [Gemmatimonadales bacterium]|nr:hypothetical protein [Gemmatimonadales bacterium]